MIQNILDNLGNTIGTIEFPDGTPASVINAALALYAGTPNPALPILGSYYLKETSAVTTSSGTPSVIQGMTKIPLPGTYAIFFSGSINTNGNSASGTFGIYANGVLIQETNRPISCNIQLLGGLVTVSLNSIGVGTYTGTQLQLDGNTTIDVRFASTNGGTIGFTERSLIFLRVG